MTKPYHQDEKIFEKKKSNSINTKERTESKAKNSPTVTPNKEEETTHVNKIRQK